jgi:hypothetical protein
MYTQRKKDRRGFVGMASFPLKTKGGILVDEERRSIPDRRLGNIRLELDDAVDHGDSEFVAYKPYFLTDKDYC